jgi:hypothetical protein
MEELLLKIDAVAQTKEKIKQALDSKSLSNKERRALEEELQSARTQLASLVQQQDTHKLRVFEDDGVLTQGSRTSRQERVERKNKIAENRRMMRMQQNQQENLKEVITSFLNPSDTTRFEPLLSSNQPRQDVTQLNTDLYINDYVMVQERPGELNLQNSSPSEPEGHSISISGSANDDKLLRKIAELQHELERADLNLARANTAFQLELERQRTSFRQEAEEAQIAMRDNMRDLQGRLEQAWDLATEKDEIISRLTRRLHALDGSLEKEAEMRQIQADAKEQLAQMAPVLGMSFKSGTSVIGGSGVRIGSVRENKAAAKAGIKENDLIYAIGTLVRSPEEFKSIISSYTPGDIVPLQIMRNSVQKVTVLLEIESDATPAKVRELRRLMGGVTGPQFEGARLPPPSLDTSPDVFESSASSRPLSSPATKDKTPIQPPLAQPVSAPPPVALPVSMPVRRSSSPLGRGLGVVSLAPPSLNTPASPGTKTPVIPVPAVSPFVTASQGIYEPQTD